MNTRQVQFDCSQALVTLVCSSTNIGALTIRLGFKIPCVTFYTSLYYIYITEPSDKLPVLSSVHLYIAFILRNPQANYQYCEQSAVVQTSLRHGVGGGGGGGGGEDGSSVTIHVL